MQQLVTTVEDVTAVWVTDVFRRGGLLPSGEAQRVAIVRTHEEQLHSISYVLQVEWSSAAPPTLPTRLFLKLPRQPDPPGGIPSGAREVQMYQRLASYQALPVIPCYDVVYDAQQRRYHLLLADLSQTHDQPTWHLHVADTYIQQTVDCLARLHAFWREKNVWEIAALPTHAQIETEIKQIETAFAPFADRLGERLTPADRSVFERVVASLPILWTRRLTPQRRTLVHGDAHFWNFLYPRLGQALPTYILDWQQAHVDWGVSDLAYTIVLRYPHRAAENERELVRRYYQALTEQGIGDYTWDQCWNDYRRAALEQLAVPILWYAGGLPEPLWSLFVPRALAAFHDLDCAELLP